MLKITDAIKEIFNSNKALLFWINEWILNLSKTAELIKPLIEVKTQKEIKLSALIMNLSRFWKNKVKIKTSQDFKFKKLSINSNLISFSFDTSPEINKKVNIIYEKIMEKWWFLTISKWNFETSIITEEKFTDLIKKICWNYFKHFENNISSIWINFDEKYLENPWILSEILSPIAMQWINFEEVTSTHTEFIIYVKRKDLNICFNTLEKKFF